MWYNREKKGGKSMRKKRKIMALILAIATLGNNVPCISVYATSAQRYFGEIAEWVDVDITEDGYVIYNNILIGYEGTETDLVIPEGVEEISTFYYNQSITSVVCPSTLKKIRKYSFFECDKLEKIVLNEGLTTIEQDVLQHCDRIKEIRLPFTVTSIGNESINDCNSLEAVFVPESLTAIGDVVFAYCDSLKEITLPNTLKILGENCLIRNNGEFGIICEKYTSSYEYAKTNNIKIKKLHKMEFQVDLSAELDRAIHTGNWEVQKGKSFLLSVSISNSPERNISYDEQELELMKLKNATVSITLPESFSFADGERTKQIHIEPVSIGEEKIVTEQIFFSPSTSYLTSLPVQIRVKSESFFMEKTVELSSFGISLPDTENHNAQEVADTSIISLSEDIRSSDNSNTARCPYGSISTISEYYVQKKHYIFYITGDVIGDWQLHVIVRDLEGNVLEKKDFPIVDHYEKYGNAIVDEAGNFYIICGHDEKMEQKDPTDVQVCGIIKYDTNMNELGRCEYKSNATSSDPSSCIKKMFSASDCETVITPDDKLFVKFAIQMYNGHQRSQMFAVDTKTMRDMNTPYAYCSHSFGQYMTILDDKIFTVDKGDVYPRGMVLATHNFDGSFQYLTEFFHFTNCKVYQNVKASIGGIAKTNSGYLFAGCSEEELSFKIQKDEHLHKRNLFIQLFDKNFTQKELKDTIRREYPKELMLLETKERRTTGIYKEEEAFEHSMVDQNTDYGVKWLTNYKYPEYAASAKTVALGGNNVALFWEKHSFDNDTWEDVNLGTFYCIIDEYGNVLQEERKLTNAKLGNNKHMVFDGKQIIWTTRAIEKNSALTVYRLNVEQFVQEYAPELVKPKETPVVTGVVATSIPTLETLPTTVISTPEVPEESVPSIVTETPTVTMAPNMTKAPDVTEVSDVTETPVASTTPVIAASPWPTATSGIAESTAVPLKSQKPATTTAPSKKKIQKIVYKKINPIKQSKLKKKDCRITIMAHSTGDGKLNYTNFTVIGRKKYIKVSSKGILTLKKGAKNGVYKVRITAAETKKYKKQTVVVKVVVKK